MSTATQVFGFRAAEADALPKLACLGYVEKLGEGKITQKGVYHMQTIHIAPMESGKKGVVNFLYVPEWLDAGFNPATLKEEADGKALYFLYGKNIMSRQSMSVLQGIAGSEENFNTLSYNLITTEDKSPEGIQAVLQNFFNEVGPTIGYVLQQRREKTGEVDENGKAIYELQPGYEVGSFFHPTDSEKARIAKQAANGKLVVTFE